MGEAILVSVSFLTALTGAMGGVAGGVILIAVMPEFLPAASVVPVHGLVQISSNLSRVLFGLKYAVWWIFGYYAAGTVVGALLGSRFLADVKWDYFPILLGSFLLLTTWMPPFSRTPKFAGKFTILGAFQTCLSLFIGVTGPLNIPFLVREGLSRDRIVITHAIQMTAMHVMKVLTFGFLGFSFAPHLYLVGGMMLGTIAGSFLGTKLRSRIPENIFRIVLKTLITLLAIRMLVKGAM